jgi:predicted DNA-binding protein (MmcQ/YjbR family)
MDGQELQKVANKYATELPDIAFEHRVNPNWETYKVHGKVFMLMTDMPGHAVVILKADPDDATALRERYEEITPGYHMDKKHWITAAGGPALDNDLVRGLVTDSYRLVVANLPKSERPVNPNR